MAHEDRTQQVSLGCGTLILIALIVLIFSGGSVRDIKTEVQSLRAEVREVKQALELQTHYLTLIQNKLDSGEATPEEGEQPKTEE